MTYQELRPQIASLIEALKQFGDQDMADLLRAYSLGKSHECSISGDPDQMTEAAQWLRDEADRVACAFEGASAAHYLAMHNAYGRTVWA